MGIKFTTVAIACVVLLGLTSGTAHADTVLAYNSSDPHFLGKIDTGDTPNPTNEAQYINCLLGYPTGCPSGQTYEPTALATTALPQAMATGASRTDTPGGLPYTGIDVTGWTYIYAKYDGPNSFAAVWYVLGLNDTVTVPQFGSIGPPAQYAMSHYTLYNPTSVPDGGVTLMLLGGVLVGLETLRRKFRA